VAAKPVTTIINTHTPREFVAASRAAMKAGKSVDEAVKGLTFPNS
jgi:hypothetical protein